VGEPERQVALQKWRAVAVIALGLARKRQLDVLRGRELAGARDPAGLAVDLVRGLHEQLDQRRVRALARDEHRRRRNQTRVARRNIAHQVGDSGDDTSTIASSVPSKSAATASAWS